MAMGLQHSIRQYSQLTRDQTPQHFLSPFQRQDMQNRMSSLVEGQRAQAESGIAQRTRDTTSPQFQQQMARLAEGSAGTLGANMADVEQKDLLMGEQKKQQRMANLQQLIQMKQQETARQQALKAQQAQGGEKKGGGGGMGAALGSIGGAALGQILIPIPGVGAAIGGAAGGAIGGAAGESATGGDAGAGATNGAMSGAVSGAMPGAGTAVGAAGTAGTAGTAATTGNAMAAGMPKVAGTATDAGMMSGMDWKAMMAKMQGMPTLFGPGTTYQ